MIIEVNNQDYESDGYAKYVIVLGETELEEQAVNVKDMKLGEQQKVAFSGLVNFLLKK